MKLLAKGRLKNVSDRNSSGLSGEIRVPGDKSISHRSIMLGSLAEGTTRVSGFLEGADALATLQAFREMGVAITDPVDGQLSIQGVGLHGLQAPKSPLDMGNSGTSIRLLSGLLAGQAFTSTLTGDSSLSSRPMERVAIPLRKMGAEIETAEGGRPPLTLRGGRQLHAIDYELPMASAQVKSCVLLAGLYARGRTSVTEPAPTRDHTERMLRGFGYDVEVVDNVASLQGGGKLTACEIDVPADISSAAFFMVAATLVPGSDVTLKHVGINPTRTGVVDILNLMGASIEILNTRESGGEPVADLRIRSADIKGIDIPPELVPLAIDEFPVLFVAAACARGKTVLTGAEELRVKESDRIQAMVEGLVALGVDAVATEDGAIIHGRETLGETRSGNAGSVVGINCYHDHRIAMSFAIASARSCCDIQVNDCENITTSFPNFVSLAQGAGLDMEKI